MSIWGAPLPNGQGNAGNQPPANPAYQGPPNAGPAPANALGLGFQAPPLNFAPPANNVGPQPPFNPFGVNANNVGLQQPINPFANNPVIGQAAPAFNQARQQAPASDSDESDFDDEDPDNIDPDLIDESPVEFRLSVPIDVSGNNNVIAIDAAKFADMISKSMIETLRNLTIGSTGIPMIDENGRPRPVNLRVDCKVKIRGHKNIVGEKAVLSMIPPPIRQAMVENALPISPLSPRENKALTEQIELGRQGMKNTEDRNGGMAPGNFTDADGAGSSTAQNHGGRDGMGITDQKKRERTYSDGGHGAGSSHEQAESSTKRPRV